MRAVEETVEGRPLPQERVLLQSSGLLVREATALAVYDQEDSPWCSVW
jgi:hypothetical protein